jgi:transposase-like protein
MPKARKVFTPGSQPGLSPLGRPVKAKKKVTTGTARKGNYRSRYTPAMLQEALQAVTEHRMSLREAAKEYGVPKTTMIDRLAGRRGEKLGRSTELTEEEENMIVERLQVTGSRFFMPISTLFKTHFWLQFLIFFTYNENLNKNLK